MSDFDYEYDEPVSGLTDHDRQLIAGAIQAGIQESAAQMQAQNSELIAYQLHQDDLRQAAEAARIAQEASDRIQAKIPAWENDKPAVAGLIAQRLELLPEEATLSVDDTQHYLETAYTLAQIESKRAADTIKERDDRTFADGLINAHRKSWSAFRAANEEGKSVHDLMGD